MYSKIMAGLKVRKIVEGEAGHASFLVLVCRFAMAKLKRQRTSVSVITFVCIRCAIPKIIILQFFMIQLLNAITMQF